METAKEMLDKVEAIKDQKPDISGIHNKAMLNGALIGFGAGAYFGYAKKKNMLVTALIGGVAGIIISRVFMPK